MRKNMKFWPLKSEYKRSNWKIWLAERFSEPLTSEFLNKKTHAAKAYKNEVEVHPSMVYQKFSTDLSWPPVFLSQIFTYFPAF